MTRRFVFIGLLLALASCHSGREQLHGDHLTVLKGATVIDGTGSPSRANSVVVLQGAKILRVGDAGQFAYPRSAKMIDVRSKWIVPGFIDSHAHMPEPQDQEAVLKTLLAFGITTVRNPGAEPSAVALRDRLARGELLGPRLVTAGNLIDAPGGIFSGTPSVTEVSSKQEARAEVRRQVAEGVDLIKVYRGLPPTLVQAVIDESHRLERPVLGHLGSTTWGEAARMGIDGVSHFGTFGTPWELVPEADQLAVRHTCQECDEGEGFRILRAVLFPQGDAATVWARLLASQHVSVEPNLVLLHSVFWSADSTALAALEPEYAPLSWRDGTWFDAVPHPYACPTAWSDEAQKTYSLFEQLVALLHQEGVVLTVGTDLMNPWMTPGVAYHREMEFLAAAGIDPASVLISATQNGAIALGLESEVGVIRQGMAADLVVLGMDPLVAISNTRAIERVFLHGVELDPNALLVRE